MLMCREPDAVADRLLLDLEAVADALPVDLTQPHAVAEHLVSHHHPGIRISVLETRAIRD
jgi:hypothetical protein